MKSRITTSLEIKGLQDKQFEGHGSIFGNVDLGGDIVLPGAFQKSLAQHKKAGSLPQMFWMHDQSRVPGKWLGMSEDSEGLAVKGVLADTELGNEIHTLLKMEAVRGLSIGYVTTDQGFDKQGNRLIKEADLWEVSVVSLPMNPLAQVAHVKSRLSADGAYVPTPGEFEAEFRRMGCSKRVARKLIAMIFDSSGETLDDEIDEKETGATLESTDPTGATLEKSETDEALEALQAMTEFLQADEFTRKLARGFL